MDIVERLRAHERWADSSFSHELIEAADEIERLRADNEMLRILLDKEVLGDPDERPGS